VWRWTRTRERPLPWRGERDPYRICVSEVMLQQTQASRVVQPYLDFLARFPSASALADADPAVVLREWGSLGYPRRALQLWRTARAVTERGGFPRTVDELQMLPGIGPYTARAIATFAFDADVGIVEANVRRVYERCFGAADQSVADRVVPRGSAARWNQAMIDLGAEVCRPRDPRCDVCPVRSMCRWDGTLAKPKPAARFDTTMRYARGRIVDALRGGDATKAQLLPRTNLSARRIDDALRALLADGLIHRAGARYRLGPSARERRRPTSLTK
jgi:A/G-specific adenine glycosylase